MPSLLVTCYVCLVDISGKFVFPLEGNGEGISGGGGRGTVEERGDTSVRMYCVREEYNKKIHSCVSCLCVSK